MEAVDKRYIDHELPEYSPDGYNEEYHVKSSLELLQIDLEKFAQKISPDEVRCICSMSSKSRKDPSIGLGAGGYLLLALKQYETGLYLNNLDDIERGQLIPLIKAAKLESLLEPQKALELAQKRWEALKPLVYKDFANWDENKSNIITYLMGAPGVISLEAQLYYHLGNVTEFRKTIKTIQETMFRCVKTFNEEGAAEYELLYGLPVNKNVKDEFKIDLEKEVIDLTFTLLGEVDPDELGIFFEQDQWRLFCQIFDSEYFGAAHGTFGVLYMLLAAYKLNQKAFDDQGSATEVMLQKLRRSYKNLISLQLPSGNFPCHSKSLQSDKLVQWCHGSPGIIPALLLASEVFTDAELKKSLLESAVKAGENVWKYGALKKGFNLCHGVLGNAMALVSLYRATKDKKWLHRAYEFSLLKNDKKAMSNIENFECKQRVCVGMSDEPYSLLNGLTGEIYFRLDMLDPMNARFPGYELL
eukprot:CAMPEP_0176473220 /NCGR_PEP_ID=MMETSP0127-20121128/42177_1 /TAXON_ID=938130 /ORGANISM="Platyophrya macrostoma, Strain WH" /LENGTH=470 /DNA_ID=CAMNT_0017868175 /DNA_START=33 /DNA_END=1446 /DNA_ORIENTATION=-